MTDPENTEPTADVDSIGRYQIVRPLARGGMAEVYLGRSIGLHGFQKLVAIKRIRAKYSNESSFINMLVDEARISMLLTHPNIAQVLEFGEQDGDYYLVLEYVPGESLSHLVRRAVKGGERLGVFEVCYILVEVLQGLHAAHVQRDQKGEPAHIVHRDVSPQNILISYEGLVKLIDFGIAKAKRRLERTEVGTIKGKLRYLAPEMIDPKRFAPGGEFDHRVDVFAAGVVLFEAIAGRKLFFGENEFDVYESIMKDEVPDLVPHGICDAPLMNIMRRALKKRPEDRYDSAEAFADDLRAYIYRREPSFTQKRIAGLMDRYFADEHAATIQLDAAAPQEIDDAPRELTFVGTSLTSPSRPGDKRGAPRVSSEPTRAQRGPRSKEPRGSRSGSSESRPGGGQIKDALVANPSAPTEMVDARVLRDALEGPPPDERDGQTVTVMADSASGTRPPDRTDTGEAAALTSVAAVSRHEKTGETPSTNTELVRASGARSWSTVIAAGVVVGLLMAVMIVFAVESGDDEPGGDAPAEGDAVPLLIDVKPKGARVVERGANSPPAEAPVVWMKTPGERLEVEITAPGYEPMTRVINVPAGEARPKLSVALTPKPVPLVVTTEPPGATVTVDGQALDEVDTVLPDRAVRVTATLDGHRDVTREFRAQVDEKLTVHLVLEPDQPEPVDEPPKRGDRKPSRTSSKPRKTSRKAQYGKLQITTSPVWAQVTIDGDPIEETTPVTVKLEAGRHKVVLTHPPKGYVKSFTVEVKANKTVRRRVSF